MISVSGKHWEEINVNKRLIEKIKSEQNISELIAKLTVSRNFDETEIYSIKNEIDLFNPFLNNSDFNECFKTLEKIIANNGKIQIIGDYDVDGIISTSLIIKLFQFTKYPYSFYIPDRIQDGYGASLELIKKLTVNKIDLVILLDCGSNSHEAIEYLNKKKIQTIVIDHHEISKPYPKTKNLINPKKECSYKNYDYFCSATLTYFFVDYFLKKKKIKNDFDINLIYVLLATVADAMPLRKLNRFIAKNIFNHFDITKNFIFNEIYKINNIKNRLSIYDLAFLIAPLFNSAGRISNATKVVNLLTSDDHTEQNKIILDLHNLNNKRKKIEYDIMKSINLDKINKLNAGTIVILLKNINEGLIGIIASKLKEYFNKPCVVFTNSGLNYKGSVRSTEDFNIGRYIKLGIDKKIILSGGGHNLAAGLTIEEKKFKLFTKFINEQLFSKKNKYRTSKYISKINPSSLNLTFFKELDLLEPYGQYNSKPLFLVEKLKIIKSSILKEKYVNCLIKLSSGKTINAISFNLIDSKISEILLYYKKEISMICEISKKIWNNKKNYQLIIKDVFLDN